MAEVTRVPLQPIEKGSLAKLWLGVLAIVVIAAAVAWFVAPKGVSLETLTEGTGDTVSEDQIPWLTYEGRLVGADEPFDQSQDLPIPTQGLLPERGMPMGLDGMIPGFVECVTQMKKGGKYRCTIPSELAYGETGQGPIPANSDLVFDIEIIEIFDEADLQRRAQQLQQMMGPPPGMEGAPGAEGAEAASEAAPAQ